MQDNMSAGLAAGDAAEISLPIGKGVFVAVVGPSGAGKDTLLFYARERFAGDSSVFFVKRAITRPCDGSSEDHRSLGVDAFEQALSRGAFALAWEAHGLKYGVPIEVDTVVAQGHVAVANLSRSVVPALSQRYGKAVIVEISAAPAILAARLASRGRETPEEMALRLARPHGLDMAGAARIDNSGDRRDGGERLVAIIREAVARAG